MERNIARSSNSFYFLADYFAHVCAFVFPFQSYRKLSVSLINFIWTSNSLHFRFTETDILTRIILTREVSFLENTIAVAVNLVEMRTQWKMIKNNDSIANLVCIFHVNVMHVIWTPYSVHFQFSDILENGTLLEIAIHVLFSNQVWKIYQMSS